MENEIDEMLFRKDYNGFQLVAVFYRRLELEVIWILFVTF